MLSVVLVPDGMVGSDAEDIKSLLTPRHGGDVRVAGGNDGLLDVRVSSFGRTLSL